ncbi:protein kinase, partial [bacterium]|nr:protein kinase [bacterium]
MSVNEDESNKDHARQIALAMMSDSTSGKVESIDAVLRDNPEIAVELERQLRLLGLVKAVTEQHDTHRHGTNAGLGGLGTTRVLGILDTGGEFNEEPTLVPCPSCRQRLPYIDFATNESSRKVTCLHCDNSVLLLNNRKGLQAGSMIAHFELVSRLGAGSFGLVWKARDTKLKRDVAIKVPRRGLLTSEQQDLFLREARVAAAIRHPYVVAIHDTGVDCGTVYICSELIKGNTLAQWNRESCDSPRTAASMMRKIAFAIQAIHDSSVIHRDLKPSNVMVDENGDPQVMDFGLAKQDVFEATMTLSGEILGTPAYMSPEAAKGESRSSDPRTDIYSIGVMLYELLTGELPFHGDFAQLVQQILHRKPPSPIDINPAVHRELETICLKCLEKEPADRYQSAHALAEDLGRFEEGRPITARPKSLPTRILRACQSRPALAISLVSLAAVLLLLASATQYVFVALRSSVSNEQDNKELRQSQQKELAKKDDELSDRKDAIAKVEAALSVNQEESRVRDSLSVLTAEIESATRLAGIDPLKSLRIATKAVMDLEALGSRDGQRAIGIEKSELLAELQQTLGDGLQQLRPFANEDLGEVILSVQSGRKNVVGVLSVSRDSDVRNPYFINVANLKGEAVLNGMRNQKLGFSRYRLSSAVNQLVINSTGSAILGFARDAKDNKAAEETRLW